MHFHVLLLLTTTILAVFAQQPLILGNANFTEVVSKEDISVTLVMFYAPWCGYSKSFLPVYDEIAWSLQDEPNIVIAKVDAVEHDALFYSENIESLGFPALLAYIKGGDPITFKEERDKESVLNFVRRLSTSSVANLEAEGGIRVFKNNYLTKPEPVVLLNTPASVDPFLLESFEYACKKMISRIKCASSTGETDTEIIMIRAFDDEPSVVTAPNTVLAEGNKLFDWMQVASYPAFPIFNKENAEFLFTDERPGFNTHVLIVLDASTEESSELLNFIDKSVVSNTDFQGKCVFAYVDHTDSANKFVQDTLQTIGISTTELAGSATVVVIKSMKDKIHFFRLDALESAGALAEWLPEVLNNQVETFRTINLN